MDRKKSNRALIFRSRRMGLFVPPHEDRHGQHERHEHRCAALHHRLCSLPGALPQARFPHQPRPYGPRCHHRRHYGNRTHLHVPGSSLTSASTAGFLQSLTVVIVPFANAALLRRAPERKVLVGTAIVTCGMLLLSGADFTSLNPGALIMLLSAFVYAGHIIVAKRFVEDVDPLALGVWQLGFGCLFSGIAAFTFGGFTLPGTPSEIVVVVALALICSAYGFITQTLVQPHVPAETTGFAFSLEPVCSAVFSFFLVGEVLNPIAFFGATLILTGVMVATVELPRLRAHGQARMAGAPERVS